MENNKDSCILKKVELKDGGHLILRKADIEDAKDIIEYLNIVGGESDNLLFGQGEFNLTIDQEKAFIGAINEENNSLMLLGTIDGRIASISQIRSANRKRIDYNSEIAISVKKDYWGLGVGSAVMETLISFAKDKGITKNITLGVKSSNDTAKRMYEKFGFKEVGIHKNFFNINGEFDDEILMDLYIN